MAKTKETTMTDTDIKWIECTHCEGIGQVDAETHLDMDDIEAVRKELVSIVNNRTDNGYGLHGANRADRIIMANRIAWLASRLAWLETSDLWKEQYNQGFELKRLKALAEKGLTPKDDPTGALADMLTE